MCIKIYHINGHLLNITRECLDLILWLNDLQYRTMRFSFPMTAQTWFLFSAFNSVNRSKQTISPLSMFLKLI